MHEVSLPSVSRCHMGLKQQHVFIPAYAGIYHGPHKQYVPRDNRSMATTFAKVSAPILSGAHLLWHGSEHPWLGPRNKVVAGLSNILVLMLQGSKVTGAEQHSSSVIKNARLFLFDCLLLQYMG